jgi:hypothetical protein
MESNNRSSYFRGPLFSIKFLMKICVVMQGGCASNPNVMQAPKGMPRNLKRLDRVICTLAC